MEPNQKSINVGILTISDTRISSGTSTETFDSSGHNLKELINNHDIIESATVVKYDCVTDDFEKIQAKMIEWCSKEQIQLLLSTGGTGFSPRDVTPEATLGLITKLTPGISQAIMNESLKITPMAMLSRAVSGIYKKTLIINLPGSKNASEQCLHIIKNAIPHAISLIRDEKENSKQFHNQCNSIVNNESKIPECVLKIACRHRESPFPKIGMKSALNILKEHSFLQYTKNNKIMYPTVCIFSTGDELISNKDTYGYIRDTNSVMIEQILEQDKYMGKILNYGIVRDNWNDLCKQFEVAFNIADIVVTSGGISMGEKDFIKHVLKEHFKSHIHFGRLDMKPGMPTTFVTLHFNDKKKYVFCLPGNPVSAGVCTHLILLPFLRSVSGRNSIVHSVKAVITHDINNLDPRPEYKRALLKYDNGEFFVSCLTDEQQSSRLLSFVGSNCLLQLPSSTKQTKINARTIMDVILIKSIENIYVAPILKKKNLKMKVHHVAKCLLDKQYQFDKTLSIQNLLDLMVEHASILKIENIPTVNAMGYVLHLPVYSTEDLPSFRASIKDGYAFKYVNSDCYWCNVFKVVQVSVAGTNPNCQEEINEHECSRISTGAPLPPGANCIIQVEDTSVISKSLDGTVELTIAVLKNPKPFDNIRNIGSDISMGQLLLAEKTEIGPFEIALLRSVGYEQVSVYVYPTIHIIPHINNSSYRISSIIKNLIKRDDFKGNVYTHPVWKELENFPKKYENSLNNGDIIIISDHAEQCNLHFDDICEVVPHFHVYNEDREISLGFGILQTGNKRIIMFHTTCHDSDSIYNCVHLFILPFLRLASGKKQYISSIKTKAVNEIDLPLNTFVKGELNYEDGNFNVTCFPSNQENCIVDLPYLIEEKNVSNSKTELDVIITENSDSYFIHY